MRRVDNSLGLLLELPAGPSGAPPDQAKHGEDPAALPPNGKQQATKGKRGTGKGATAGPDAKTGAATAHAGASAAGYAHISAVADARIEKLDKARALSSCLIRQWCMLFWGKASMSSTEGDIAPV